MTGNQSVMALQLNRRPELETVNK